MSSANRVLVSPLALGRLAWTALWWLIALSGCTILIVSCLVTLKF